MNFTRQLLQSTTNRLVTAIVLVHIIVTALFAGQHSGMELYSLSHPQFHLWQMATYLFLHADWWHLGLNMLALWSFGRVLERAWGGQRLMVFFLLCGIGAAAAHLAVSYYEFSQLSAQLMAAGMSQADLARTTIDGLDLSSQFANVSSGDLRRLWQLQNTPAVGASGAVYGVLVAFALFFPNFKVILIFLPIPVAARYFVPVLLLIDLSAGLTGFSIFGYNVAHFAHLGGALVGFLLVQLWLRRSLR